MAVSSMRCAAGGVMLLLVLGFAPLGWAAEAAKAKPAQPSAVSADPFQVPNGTLAELVSFMERIAQQRPAELDFESGQSFRLKQCKAIVTAADRILAAKPDEDQTETAVHYRSRALAMLERMGDGDAGKRLESFPEELEKAGRTAPARDVRRMLLQRRLYHVFTGSVDDLRKAVNEVKQFVGQTPLPADLNLMFMATQLLEMKGATDLAADTYRDFGKVLSASGDKMMAALGAKMEGAARRVGLVGKPLTLEGTFVDGKPLKWADYRGKVVLVMFWATWCQPCRAEIPDVKENYQAYHDRGFDVLGISCDDDRAQLEEFLKEESIPWKTLFSDAQGASGMSNPMASHYGVLGVPTLILVGKDGNVASMDLRGPKLHEQLVKLLGPIAEASEKKIAPAAK